MELNELDDFINEINDFMEELGILEEEIDTDTFDDDMEVMDYVFE